MNITRNALVGIALGMAAVSAADTEKTTPTGWMWLENVAESTIDDLVDDGFRLIDLEINQTSPHRFAGVMVRNSGSYQKAWAWRYNRTKAQLDDTIASENMRVIDLEVQRISGQIRLAAVMIRNAGEDEAQSEYVFDRSFDWIENRVNSTGSRLIDLDSYIVGGQRLWSAVLVRNTGSQYRDWWWYSNLRANEINGKLALHDAYIVDVEPRPGNRFSVVLQSKPRTGSSWYAPAMSGDQLRAFYRQRKGRIIDLERVGSGNSATYYASVLDNANDLERRVRDLALGQTDGVFGFYFRKMGGGTRAEVNGDYIFYPASTIKILQHLYSMRQTGLSNPQVPLWPNSTSDFHSSASNPPTESLATMQTQMMVNSNNQRTNCIQDYYGRFPFMNQTWYLGDLGRSRMNQFGWNVAGMSSDTALNHKFGAGGPANNPANRATLIDFGILYEKFGQGALLSPLETLTACGRMLWNQGPNNSHNFFSAVNSVIGQEAAAAGLTGAALQDFRNSVNVMMKPGNFTTGANIQYVSIAGMIYLPFKDGNVVTASGYVFGSFIDQYTFANFSVTGNGSPQITVEAMRDEIRAAIESFL